MNKEGCLLELALIKEHYPEKLENLRNVLKNGDELTNIFWYSRCFYGALAGMFLYDLWDTSIEATDIENFSRKMAFDIRHKLQKSLTCILDDFTPIESAISSHNDELTAFLKEELL